MDVGLTTREVELILAWRTDAFFPDEERVLGKLRRYVESGEPASLSRLQVQIIFGWIEEQVSGHYGGGRVMNPEEESILRKLQSALAA